MGNTFDQCTDQNEDPAKNIPENQKMQKRDPLAIKPIQKESETIGKKSEEEKENNEIEKSPELISKPEENQNQLEQKQKEEIKEQPKEQEEKIKVTIGMQTDDLPQPVKKAKKKRNPVNLDIQVQTIPETEKSTSPLMAPIDYYEMPSQRPSEYVPEEVKNAIEKQAKENKQQKGKSTRRKKMPVIFNEDQIFDENELIEQSKQYKMIMQYNQGGISEVSTTTYYQDKHQIDMPQKLSFQEFINLEEGYKYTNFILGGDQYLEEDFKLIHLSKDNQFFNTLGDHERIVNLSLKCANVYGAAGIIKSLVGAINQLRQLVVLELDLTPNIDLLNKLVECNENIKMAKIKKKIIKKSKILKQQIQANQLDDTEIEQEELENQMNLLIKEQKQTYKTYRSYLLTTNEVIQLTGIKKLPRLTKLMINLSLNLLDEIAIQGMLSYCSELNQLSVLKLNCCTQFSGIFKENYQQYAEFLSVSLKKTQTTFS